MTLPWRETLTWLAIVLIVFLGLGFVVPHFLDFTRMRATFENSFSTALKMPVAINGAIDVALLPEPHLILNKVSIGNDGSAADFSVERIEVELAAMSLLRGEFHIVKATLDHPVLSATMKADGSFPIFPDGLNKGHDSSGAWSGAVEELRINNGEILWRSAPRAEPVALRKLQLSGQAGHLEGPWRFEGTGDYQSRAVDVILTTGAPDGSGMLRARLNLDAKQSRSKILIDGRVGVDKTLRFDGKVTSSGVMKWPDGAGISDQPWSLNTDMRIDGAALELRTITLEGGGERGNLKLEGSGLGTLGAKSAISARFEARQLDLDKAMTTEAVPAPRLAQVVEAWKTAIVGLPRDPAFSPKLDLSFAIDGIVLGGDSLTNVDLALQADDKNGIVITRANAALPGDATVKIKGNASLDYGGSFSGNVVLNAKDAPHLLGWLESESSGRSSRVGDAKTLGVDTDISVSPFNFGASNLKLTIDKSLMSGLVNYNMPEAGARGRLVAQFYSERLLLDQVPDARAVTSRLNGTDIELTIKADRVEVPRAAGSQAGKMVLKASASESGIVIDTLDIADLGGASVKANGRLTAAGEKIDLKIDAPNAAPLLALVKKLIPGSLPVYLSDRAKALSPLKLAINAERGADAAATIKFNYDGTAATTSVKGQGQVKSNSGDPDIKMDFDFSSADAPQALRQYGFDLAPLPLDGGAKLSGKIEGRYSQGLAVNITGNVGVSTIESSLRADVAQIKYAGTLAFNSPDVLPLQQILSLPVPDATQHQAVKLQSKLGYDGTVFALNELKGQWGGQTVTGALTLDTNLQRLDGRLETDTASLGALASLGIGVIAAPAQGSIWSAQRFTPPVAPPFDINLDLALKRVDLALGKFAENVKTKLHWQQDGIELRDFSGDLLKGRLSGTLTLRRQGTLANYVMKAKATALPITTVMPNTWLDGFADLDVDASGAGDTLSTLVASMSGGGTLVVNKGSFAKLDVTALNAATEKLDQEKDPIDARKVRDQMSATLDRAPLALNGANGLVTISNGVARIGPLQINKAPYSLQGTINADLKTLKIDSRFNLYTEKGPQNWSGPMPQIGLAYRTNVQNGLDRDVDVSTLANILTTRQVSRELQRLEAQQKEQLRIELLQYDQREKTYFDKRVKLGRDLDERARQQAEAQKLADEKKQADEQKKADQNFFNSIQKSLVPLPPLPQISEPDAPVVPKPPVRLNTVPLPPLGVTAPADPTLTP